MIGYLLLAGAIACEVFATSMMKAARWLPDGSLF